MEELLTTMGVSLTVLISVSGVTERISELIMNAIEEKSKRVMQSYMKQLFAVTVAVCICIGMDIRLISDSSIPAVANAALAGLLCGLGSSFLHDVVKLVTNVKDLIRNISSV